MQARWFGRANSGFRRDMRVVDGKKTDGLIYVLEVEYALFIAM